MDPCSGLSPAQAAAVTHPAATLAVIAGPGAGKTRVLTRRIAWRCAQAGADPARTLVLTFSRRAARELSHRLGQLGLPSGVTRQGVTAGTFHAVAFAEIARHRAERGQPAPHILGRPARLLRPALAGVLGREPRGTEVSDLAASLARSRVGGHGVRPLHGTAAAAAAAYERAKKARGVLDLDDLLDVAARLVEDDPDAAALAHWRYRHVYVDEYQDLNPGHVRLLRAWVGGRDDLFVVGDPDQAIYGFNGAAAGLFDRAHEDWPGIEVIRLGDNFRSTPEVVGLARAIQPGPPAAVPDVSPVPSGPLPRLHGYPDPASEADAIAAAIASRRTQGGGWSGCAVLARTNARLRLIAAALDRAGVPWRLRDPRPLADREAVRGWLDTLPRSAPARDLADVIAELPDHPDRDPLGDAYTEYLATMPATTVGAFIDWLDATGVTAADGASLGVDLATFHRAKGLEWTAVWVAGVEEGLVPLASAHDVDEEQRLLYVALTRAETELAVTWSTARGGPSRWVAALTAAGEHLGARPAEPDQRVRLRSLRTALDGADGDGDRRRHRTRVLRAWRESQARAAAVPPAVVLPDGLLGAVASSEATAAADIADLLRPGGRRAARWAPALSAVLLGDPGPPHGTSEPDRATG